MYLHESYNIEALNFLLDSININIPQLKAFNLMKFTRKITTEELNEMIIENFKGILEYEDYYIRINTSLGIININGFELKLENMTNDDIKVNGKVESIDIERNFD